jgi:hypothetical protein
MGGRLIVDHFAGIQDKPVFWKIGPQLLKQL